jgi:hypothetical protein
MLRRSGSGIRRRIDSVSATSRSRCSTGWLKGTETSDRAVTRCFSDSLDLLRLGGHDGDRDYPSGETPVS